MEDEGPSEPLFRSHKRRKVLRQRPDAQAEPDEGIADANHEVVKISNHADSADDSSAAAIRFQRKSTGRKHGIAFTSTEGRSGARDQESEGKAVVLASTKDTEDEPGNDRFIKPTGKVAVTEDKHMMAYIDSKLAEARSPTPLAGGVESRSSDQCDSNVAQPAQGASSSAIGTSQRTGERTYQDALARSYKTYQRPTKRRPKQRDEADIARDSMIDQIMQESSVPLYDRLAPKTAAAADEDEVDNDAATAEAFKAQLLMEMEMHNRRRLAPKVKDKDAPTGPKLGGSRSQREKMKALEEANKSGGTKK